MNVIVSFSVSMAALSLCGVFFSLFFLVVLFTGAFRLYDVDNDGFITRDEMYNIVDAIYQMVVRNNIYYIPYNICYIIFTTTKHLWGRLNEMKKNNRQEYIGM